MIVCEPSLLVFVPRNTSKMTTCLTPARIEESNSKKEKSTKRARSDPPPQGRSTSAFWDRERSVAAWALRGSCVPVATSRGKSWFSTSAITEDPLATADPGTGSGSNWLLAFRVPKSTVAGALEGTETFGTFEAFNSSGIYRFHGNERRQIPLLFRTKVERVKVVLTERTSAGPFAGLDGRSVVGSTKRGAVDALHVVGR